MLVNWTFLTDVIEKNTQIKSQKLNKCFFHKKEEKKIKFIAKFTDEQDFLNPRNAFAEAAASLLRTTDLDGCHSLAGFVKNLMTRGTRPGVAVFCVQTKFLLLF